MTEVTNEVQEAKEELTVEVDGKQHKISDLSAEVQDMLKMHQSWNHDAAVKADAAQMARAAVQHVANQIVEAIRSEAIAEEQAEGDAVTTAQGGTPAV